MKNVAKRMPPSMIGVYVSPDFHVVWEVLDAIAARDRIGMSTLVKRALTEWATDHGLDPDYVMKKDQDSEIRREVTKKMPCRFRLMTSPTTIVCKAGSLGGEQKPLASCIDCEDHDPA